MRTVNRRHFLASSFAAALHADTSRPNIVFILCDDLGYGDLGCYGNRIIRTPSLDRLAGEGVRFTQFYMPSPVCSPSRAALMTGQYPQRYGIHSADVPENSNRFFLPASAVTVAEVLQPAGYYTAHIGKWHLGEPPDAPHPLDQGFDHFFGLFGGRPSSPWIKYARSVDPEMILNRERPKVCKGHITRIQTDAALEVLDKRPAARPFFLNLWYNAPHEPLAPIPGQEAIYKHWDASEQTYFQTVTDIDSAVARILRRIAELGLDRDTLILFASDNGPENHTSHFSRGSGGPLKGMKTQLWEGGIRVPAILRWPAKLPAGAVSKLIAGALDVLPTFAAAARAPLPYGVSLDGGVDLVRTLTRGENLDSRPLFFENFVGQRGTLPYSLPVAVRKGRWKLFASVDLGSVQLYDLDTDPGEQQDLALRFPEVVRDLTAELRRWRERVPYRPLPPGHRVETPTLEELEKRYYRN
jgi:arylsulfatase A-like enzyme